MSLILDGTNGISDVDGTAAAPAIRGTDANTGIFFPAADTIAFAEGGAEIARFDSNGKLIVGGTSSTYGTRLGLISSASGNPLLSVENTRNVSGDSSAYFTLGTNTSDTNSFFAQMFNASQDKAYIYGNGSFANRTGTYGTISDVSMKKNIVNATPKLNDVMALQVRNFEFIDSETDGKQIGFIAQELEQIFPSLVFENGKTGMKEIKTSVLIPVLVKAIQEQQALITALTTRITALEAA